MSVEFLKKIRNTEKECEKKLKIAESTKQNAIMEAEKVAILKVRDTDIQARLEAEKIIASIKNRVEQEYVKMLNESELENNNLKEKTRKVKKQALDYILSIIM